jgi:hypothetical protein
MDAAHASASGEEHMLMNGWNDIQGTEYECCKKAHIGLCVLSAIYLVVLPLRGWHSLFTRPSFIITQHVVNAS